MAQVINLTHYREQKQKTQEAVVIYRNIRKLSDREEFDLNFLKLVDSFMREQDPLYLVKFDRYLERLEREGNIINN